MRFVETRVFTAAVAECLGEESYRLFQLAIASRPDLGKLIRGSGGLRKVRWGTGQRGKRGGARVIYYWRAGTDVCYLLFTYSKNRDATIGARQLQVLRKLIAEELE
jgi:hypothetical protein